jgi:hypothetical protein
MQIDPGELRREPPPNAGGDPFGHARGQPPPRSESLDVETLFALLDALRRAAPAEVESQLTKLIREFLLTLRSLIDWYLERLDGPPRAPEVEDIPID